MSRFPIIPALSRPVCAKPCNECPFRRKAMPGWLGAATPQSFIIEISMERPLPCHSTIDYDDPTWLEQWNAGVIGNICAGSLIMSANMGKLPRDPAFPRKPRDTSLVFAAHTEFIAHHESAPVRSWEMGDAPREMRTLCSNCGSSAHLWCCARCGKRTRTRTYQRLDSNFCSAKCARDQARDDRASDAMERNP